MRVSGSVLFSFRGRRHPAGAGFTLLELVTTVLIIAILMVMLLPVFTHLRDRAERTRCMSNMTALHVAAQSYMQDYRHWPQVNSKGVAPNDLATAWIATLHPYGLEQINWICPTVQRALENPDLSDHDNTRIDYAAFPFDSNPSTPSRWSNMPWFVESNDAHGNGPLVIYRDGSIKDAADVFNSAHPATPSPR